MAEEKNIGCLGMLAWGIGAVVVTAFVMNWLTAEDEPATTCSPNDAPFYAQQAVEAVLKNPDEADFTAWSTWEVKPVGVQYEVTGQVTATNSFNAKIKNTFHAIVRCDKGTWYLGKVTME